jgi:hypothetical protein
MKGGCFLKSFNLCSDLCYILGEHSDKIVLLPLLGSPSLFSSPS